MDVERLPATVSIGAISVALAYPVFWLLGYTGVYASIYETPAVCILAAVIMLKRAHVRHWLAIPLPASAVLIALYKLYLRYNATLSTPGFMVWIYFVLMAGVLYGCLFWSVERSKGAPKVTGLSRLIVTFNLGYRYYLLLLFFLIAVGKPLITTEMQAAQMRDEQRTDNITIVDLNTLADAIDEHETITSKRVSSLSEMAEVATVRAKQIQTRLDQYSYHVTGPNTYQLCATFLTANSNQDGRLAPHPKGHVCFDFQEHTAPATVATPTACNVENSCTDDTKQNLLVLSVFAGGLQYQTQKGIEGVLDWNANIPTVKDANGNEVPISSIKGQHVDIVPSEPPHASAFEIHVRGQ